MLPLTAGRGLICGTPPTPSRRAPTVQSLMGGGCNVTVYLSQVGALSQLNYDLKVQARKKKPSPAHTAARSGRG